MNRSGIEGYKFAQLLSAVAIFFGLALNAFGQPVQSSERMANIRNATSQRYEVNQTYDKRVFYKDNNIWAYDKEFADIFGMPDKYIEDQMGISAAAFRIEDSSYQECGFGGVSTNCRRVTQCIMDLYFNEHKTPLPWATDLQSQWLPWYSSMRWLRAKEKAEKPNGMDAPDPPKNVIQNEVIRSPIIAFADPISKRQAIFTTNASTNDGAGADESGALAILGYSRNVYANLSVVSLQFGCGGPVRSEVTLRLESKLHGVFGPAIAKFSRVTLPTEYVARIKEVLNAQSQRDEAFYKSLFLPPLGTKGQEGTSPQKN